MPSEYTDFALTWAGALFILFVLALLIRAIFKIHAINKRMNAADESRSRALLTDPATGLLNRLGLEAALANRQKAADQEEGSFCAICLKIDDWALQSYAASFGPDDEVCHQLADRLAQSCPPASEIGSLGSGEFIILCKGNPTVALDLGHRLLTSLAAPFTNQDGLLRLKCTMGIAHHPEHGKGSQLMLNASIAAHKAPCNELAIPCLYSPQLSRELREQTLLLADLRQALARKQFEIHLQPKVDAQTLNITAVEALIRWRHPIRGYVSPALFIPIAERSGLIGEIGDWVITEACAVAGELHKMGLPMRVAINLSSHQLREQDLVSRLDQALKNNRVSPDRLTCEITEAAAMEESKATHATFERLRALGLHVSIDDFGTGHSSLAKLRQLPASELKVDRAFVSDLVQSEGARTITGSIISMAKALKLRVVAEGVETLQQCEILKKMGCDELQGFLFSMPIPAAEMLKLAMEAPADRKTPGFAENLYDATLPTLLN